MNDILQNIDRIHTTPMGVERLRRNMNIREGDIVEIVKKLLIAEDARIERVGKNWYVESGTYRITVNATSYTIITAHII